MPEVLDEQSHLESTTVNIYRTASTVKGGRRFSFGALVVVGDRRGRVSYGYAKSGEVPAAIEKAQKKARQGLFTIPMIGRTIPHEVEGKFSASKVRLMPASPGTGVVAGATVRAILEMAGIADCLTKCYGSTNKLNVIKATFAALEQLQVREKIADLRGVAIDTTVIEERVKKGQRFMPQTSGEKMRGPVNTVGQERGRGGRGGRGGDRGGRGGRRSDVSGEQSPASGQGGSGEGSPSATA